VHKKTNEVFTTDYETHVGHNHEQEIEARHYDGYDYDDDDDHHGHHHNTSDWYWIVPLIVFGFFALICIPFAFWTPPTGVAVSIPDGYKLVPKTDAGRRFKNHVDLIDQIRSKHYE
jgi:hypothetical protein